MSLLRRTRHVAAAAALAASPTSVLLIPDSVPEERLRTLPVDGVVAAGCSPTLPELRAAQVTGYSAYPLPVPSTSIYSRMDGIVAWQNCIEPFGAMSDNIEVHGSHCGLGVNPAVLYAVADRLAQPEGEWTPFNRDGLRALFYPSAGHA